MFLCCSFGELCFVMYTGISLRSRLYFLSSQRLVTSNCREFNGLSSIYFILLKQFFFNGELLFSKEILNFIGQKLEASQRPSLENSKKLYKNIKWVSKIQIRQGLISFEWPKARSNNEALILMKWILVCQLNEHPT